MACTGGTVGGEASGQGGEIGARTSGAGGAAAEGGQALDPATCRVPAARIWKLTPAQYEATAGALIPGGAAGAAVALRDSLPSAVKGSIVTNEASALVMSMPHVSSLLDAADSLAEQAWPRRGEWLPCLARVGFTRACVEEFVASFAARAFRRPVTAAERDALAAFWVTEKSASNEELAWKQMVAAIFLSPHMLYRTELGPLDQTGEVTLTGHEKASLLSYLLLDGPPDAELVSAASSGALDRDDGLAEQVGRLLAAPASAAGVMNFFDQHFATSRLVGLAKDSTAFPQWSATLAADLRQETQRFVQEVLWNDDGTLRTLLTADFTMANQRVAAFHQVPPPPGEGFARVSLAATPRRGALGLPGVLAALSRDLDTFVVQRGKYVREAVLCQEIPPPPETVEAVPIPPDGEHTQRELFAVHTEDESCAVCHTLMDPIGLAFENFDATGRYRATEFGRSLDVSGTLAEVSQPGEFAGPGALMELISSQPETGPCFARRFHAFAAGRLPAAADACAVASLSEAFMHDGGRVLPMIERLLGGSAYYQRVRQE